MANMPFVKRGVPRHVGRSIAPKIVNIRNPFEPQRRLFDSTTRVLDLAMGYGVDIAQVKAWYPEAACVGIDSRLRVDEKIWEDGFSFSYGMARHVVRSCFGADVLPGCKVFPADALRCPIKAEFAVVLCLGLLHQLTKPDMRRVLTEAYCLLVPGGVLCLRDPMRPGTDGEVAVSSGVVQQTCATIGFSEWLTVEEGQAPVGGQSVAVLARA